MESLPNEIKLIIIKYAGLSFPESDTPGSTSIWSSDYDNGEGPKKIYNHYFNTSPRGDFIVRLLRMLIYTDITRDSEKVIEITNKLMTPEYTELTLVNHDYASHPGGNGFKIKYPIIAKPNKLVFKKNFNILVFVEEYLTDRTVVYEYILISRGRVAKFDLFGFYNFTAEWQIKVIEKHGDCYKYIDEACINFTRINHTNNNQHIILERLFDKIFTPEIIPGDYCSGFDYEALVRERISISMSPEYNLNPLSYVQAKMEYIRCESYYYCRELITPDNQVIQLNIIPRMYYEEL